MTKRLLIATCVIGLSVGGGSARAQDTGPRYRNYALGDGLASVVAASGARDARTKTLHERPERLQSLEWRAGYADPSDPMADPVRDLRFYFVGDQLYRIEVHYDRNRTLGLTSADLVEAIDATYGASLAVPTSRAAVLRDVAGDMAVVRQWRLPDATLTLFGGVDTPDYMLVLMSTPLAARAAAATREAERLDAIEAPKRAIDAQRKDVLDAQDAKQRARARNKPAFRP
jgi:hypothetical protein